MVVFIYFLLFIDLMFLGETVSRSFILFYFILIFLFVYFCFESFGLCDGVGCDSSVLFSQKVMTLVKVGVEALIYF